MPNLTQLFIGCPLCESREVRLYCEAPARQHPLWHAPLPETLRWVQCESCNHIFTESYWDEEGLDELFKNTHPGQVFNARDFQAIEIGRLLSSRIIDWVGALPRGYNGRTSWLDIGTGAGHLALTAAEFGFNVTAVDARESTINPLKTFVEEQKIDMEVSLAVPENTFFDVISLADVIEHVEKPRLMLRACHKQLTPGGFLFVSCPNRDSYFWHAMGSHNPYWWEIEHYHNFSRESLEKLLIEEGFTPAKYRVSERYKACMEIVAWRN